MWIYASLGNRYIYIYFVITIMTITITNPITITIAIYINITYMLYFVLISLPGTFGSKESFKPRRQCQWKPHDSTTSR